MTPNEADKNTKEEDIIRLNNLKAEEFDKIKKNLFEE